MSDLFTKDDVEILDGNYISLAKANLIVRARGQPVYGRYGEWSVHRGSGDAQHALVVCVQDLQADTPQAFLEDVVRAARNNPDMVLDAHTWAVRAKKLLGVPGV